MTAMRKTKVKKGTLFVVATPIGHLEDITLRAIKVLKQVDIIACEDTRQTRKLLNRYDIKTKVVSYHKFNELKRSEYILELLKKGKDAALVSDAGTPGISDPGYLLVTSALEKDVPVTPVPGPSALTSILSISGVPLHSFSFYGFLPRKRHEREKFLTGLRHRRETLIFYESPHRVMESLLEMLKIFGPRKIVIGREMTKIHEETIRGTLKEAVNSFKQRETAKRKGEYTIILDGAKNGEIEEQDIPTYDYFIELIEEVGLERKEAMKLISRKKNIPKSQVYKEILEGEGKI